MREIKLRAWDKENSCWYKPVFKAYEGELFELLISFSGDMLAHTMKGMVHESKFPGRFELMQFTGLHDKNGKEIYEGDIVSIKEHMNPLKETRKQVVEWTNGKGDQAEFIGIGFYPWNMVEVIGNIYENSELLKKLSEV